MNATANSTAGFVVAEVERNAGTRAGQICRTLGNFVAYRTTLAELRELTDRQLSDLGMCRDRLKQTARRAVYGN